MKIAFISTFFTGATLPLMKHLCEKGHQTDLYLFCRQGIAGQEILAFDKAVKGANICKINDDNSVYSYLESSTNIYITPYYLVKNRKYLIGFVSYFRNILIQNKLVSLLKERKYDSIYVIVHEEHDAIFCKKLKNRGFHHVFVAYHEVVESHIENPKLKQCVMDTLNLGYPIVTYSQHTQKLLQKLSGIADIHVTYFGTFEAYHFLDTSVQMVKKPYILFIGCILPYKGLPFLYETIRKHFYNPSFKVVVAGSGEDQILNQIRNDNHFILINRYLSDKEFANLIRYAKCIICPYVSGSQSGITQSAMVYGTPVVATKVGAFPEFIEEGKNGYLVDYGDTEGLAEAIKRLLDGQFTQGYIPDHLRWTSIVKCVESLLKE